MNKELVDGLGYDESKQQYFTVVYGWKNIVRDQKKTKFIELKSGITKYDVYHAMASSVPTRGKQFSQKAIFGYQAERKYLPTGITQQQANLIVQKMDLIFKDAMIELGYSLRVKYKDIGTEFYKVNIENGIPEIKKQWDNALSQAMFLVLGKRTKLINLSEIKFLGSQYEITKTISNSLKTNNRIRLNIACGYGKGFIIYVAPYEWKPFKKSKILFYNTHNIPATHQLALTHAKYAEGTKYQGDFKRIAICSDVRRKTDLFNYGIDTYTASDSRLPDILKEYMQGSSRVAFYINKQSSREFYKVFEKVAKQIGYEERPGSILDESHEFTGDTTSIKTYPVTHCPSDYLVSVTASERRRGSDTNTERIYNDDPQYFGKLIVNITPQDAIEEGRNCPIEFKRVEVANGNTLGSEIMRNTVCSVIIKRKRKLIRGRMFHALITLVKSIRDDKRTHPLLICHQMVDVESAIRVLEVLQQEGYIPTKYKIVRGLRKDGLEACKQFNNESNAILVGTSWMLTGINAPNIDAIIPLYDIGSTILAVQGIGRGQRIVDDKRLIVYITTNPETRAIPVMLQVAFDFINNKNSIQLGTETLITEDELEINGSVRQRAITYTAERENDVDPALRAEWDEFDQNIHTSESFGKLVAKTFTGKHFGDKTKEQCFIIAKKDKTWTNFIKSHNKWYEFAAEQPWYNELRRMMGARNKWIDEKEVIQFLSQFSSRQEAIKASGGESAILWLRVKGKSQLQEQIWPGFKCGKGQGSTKDNEKLSDSKLEQKVLSLSKQLKTVSYTRLAKALRELKISAGTYEKIKSILITNNLI